MKFGIRSQVGLTLGFFGALAMLVAALPWLTGCNSNNPSGPATAAITQTTGGTQTAANASATGAITGRVVSASGAGLANIPVQLTSSDGSFSSRFTTTSDGSYAFNAVANGFYILRAGPSNDGNFQQASTIVFVEGGSATAVNALALPDLGVARATQTIDLVATIATPLSPTNSTLSLAEVTLNPGGIRTVTNGFGGFRLTYVPLGVNTLTITKPGMTPYTVSFEVIAGANPTIADHVLYQGGRYYPTAGTRVVDTMPVLTAAMNLAPSAVLTGTAKQYREVAGQPGVFQAQPWANQQFQLFATDNNGVISNFRTVFTDASGAWLVDNIPPDSFSFAAVDRNAEIRSRVEGTRTVYYVEGTVYTNGYSARSGLTTVMDFVVPLRETSAAVPTISAPTLVAPAALTTFSSGQLVDFSWTAVASAEAYRVAIYDSRGQSVGGVFLSQEYFGTSTQVNLALEEISMGRYSWTVGAKQTIRDQVTYVYAPARILLVRPAPTDLRPTSGTTIQSNATGSSPVTFTWPADSGAANVILEIRSALSGNQVFSTTQSGAMTTVTVPLQHLNSAAGTDRYQWRVSYTYTDVTTPLDTDWVDLNLQHP